MIVPVAVTRWEPLHPGQPVSVSHAGGVLALDGERELVLHPGDGVTITLHVNAFSSIDVDACMRLAATRGLFQDKGVHDLIHADS
jgi:hypothetical protein